MASLWEGPGGLDKRAAKTACVVAGLFSCIVLPISISLNLFC